MRMPSGKRGWSLEDMRIGGMITNFQVGRERNGREGRMGERIRGNLKEEGWEGCQERSQIGQQFPGHLQGNDNCSAPNPCGFFSESWSVCMLYILQRTPMLASLLTPYTPPCKYNAHSIAIYVSINNVFAQNGGRGGQDDNNNQNEKGPQGVPACPVLISHLLACQVQHSIKLAFLLPKACSSIFHYRCRPHHIFLSSFRQRLHTMHEQQGVKIATTIQQVFRFFFISSFVIISITKSLIITR